jgi:hypothetical protein
MTAELERASVGRSYWGSIERSPLASPLSGTRPFGSVLEWFGQAGEKSGASPKSVGPAAVMEMAARAAGLAYPESEWLLIGEKKAIGLRGFHDPENEVSINRAGAARLGVSGRNYLLVKSPAAEREFRVRVSDGVPDDVLMIGANVHSNRSLFPLTEDELTGDVTVPPVGVTLEKTERVPVAGGENLSVWA